MQPFVSHLTTWLCTRRFSEVTFRPSGSTNHWKNTVNRDFPTFSRTRIFLLPTLSLLFSLLDFSVLTLPTSAFPSLHIVGSLTSKLPSTIKTPKKNSSVQNQSPQGSAFVVWKKKRKRPYSTLVQPEKLHNQDPQGLTSEIQLETRHLPLSENIVAIPKSIQADLVF